MMKKTLIVIVLLGLSASATAGDAHVCHSPEYPVLESHNVNDSTVFTCGSGIKATLPELAKQGWKVVQMFEVSASTSLSDPSKNTAFSQLIIQKD